MKSSSKNDNKRTRCVTSSTILSQCSRSTANAIPLNWFERDVLRTLAHVTSETHKHQNGDAVACARVPCCFNDHIGKKKQMKNMLNRTSLQNKMHAQNPEWPWRNHGRLSIFVEVKALSSSNQPTESRSLLFSPVENSESSFLCSIHRRRTRG